MKQVWVCQVKSLFLRRTFVTELQFLHFYLLSPELCLEFHRMSSSILPNTTFSDVISGHDEHFVVGCHRMTSLPAYTKPTFLL